MRPVVCFAVCTAALIAAAPVFAQSAVPAPSNAIYSSAHASSPIVTDGLLALGAICAVAGAYLLSTTSDGTNTRS